MENFRHCPICTEVPEREIYQCTKGHIICHLCISKVEGGRCPQCRIPFGEEKIRSRVLEEILDGQEFECKFKDKGCAQMCKRGEMTSHANACSFNPDTVPLCQLLGVDCGFRLGIVSRAEVIAHFETVHGIRTNLFSVGTWGSLYSRENITDLIIKLKSRKRKVSQALPIAWGLVAPSGSETSPLLLICILLNRPVDYLSLICFKVWDSGTNPSSNFKVKFELSKGSTSSSDVCAKDLRLSSNQRVFIVNCHSDVVVNAFLFSQPFPISSSMKVCSFKEADRIMAATPINVALSLLKESRFGAHAEDCIRVKISEII